MTGPDPRPPGTALHPLAAAGAAGATNVAITALTLLNSILMARLLGPEGRGVLFGMTTFPAAAAALVGSFLHPVLARRAAAGEPPARLAGLAVVATAPLAGATLVASAALLLFAGGQLDPAQKQAALLYALLWAPPALALLNFQANDLGGRRWRRYNALRLVPYPVILAGLLACLAAGRRDPALVLAVLAASNVVPMAARLWIARGDGGFERVGPRDLLALGREAPPFVAAAAGAAALAHADQIVAAVVLPPTDAGIFAVAQRAGLMLGPIASAAGVVSFSEAARAPGDADPRPWSGAFLSVLALWCLLLVPAVWLLVPVLYGDAFAAARLPAVLALGGGALAAVAEVRERRLEGAGTPLSVVPGRLAGAAALVAVAGPAGLRWGPAGIVAATVVAQCVRAAVLMRAPSVTRAPLA